MQISSTATKLYVCLILCNILSRVDVVAVCQSVAHSDLTLYGTAETSVLKSVPYE